MPSVSPSYMPCDELLAEPARLPQRLLEVGQRAEPRAVPPLFGQRQPGQLEAAHVEPGGGGRVAAGLAVVGGAAQEAGEEPGVEGGRIGAQELRGCGPSAAPAVASSTTRATEPPPSTGTTTSPASDEHGSPRRSPGGAVAARGRCRARTSCSVRTGTRGAAAGFRRVPHQQGAPAGEFADGGERPAGRARPGPAGGRGEVGGAAAGSRRAARVRRSASAAAARGRGRQVAGRGQVHVVVEEFDDGHGTR